MKIYHEKNFPYNYEKLFFAKSKWPQNFHRPLDEIVSHLNNFQAKDKPVLNLIDGAISLYHGKDLKWIYREDIKESQIAKNNCYIFDPKQYRALVSSKKLQDICLDEKLELIEFENSNIYVIKYIQN